MVQKWEQAPVVSRPRAPGVEEGSRPDGEPEAGMSQSYSAVVGGSEMDRNCRLVSIRMFERLV